MALDREECVAYISKDYENLSSFCTICNSIDHVVVDYRSLSYTCSYVAKKDLTKKYHVPRQVLKKKKVFPKPQVGKIFNN